MEPNRFRKQFTDAADACALAQAIVDTVRDGPGQSQVADCSRPELVRPR
jgi:hypothetical protein